MRRPENSEELCISFLYYPWFSWKMKAAPFSCSQLASLIRMIEVTAFPKGNRHPIIIRVRRVGIILDGKFVQLVLSKICGTITVRWHTIFVKISSMFYCPIISCFTKTTHTVHLSKCVCTGIGNDDSIHVLGPCVPTMKWTNPRPRRGDFSTLYGVRHNYRSSKLIQSLLRWFPSFWVRDRECRKGLTLANPQNNSPEFRSRHMICTVCSRLLQHEIQKQQCRPSHALIFEHPLEHNQQIRR